MDKIKVLHLIPNLILGGGQMVVYHLAVNQMKSGLVTPQVCAWVGGPLEERLKNDGVPVIRIRSNPKIIRFIELLKLIRNTNPHVLHVHLFNDAFYGRLAGLVASVPVMVRTFHSRLFFEKKHKRLLPEKILQPYTDGLVCVSEYVRDHLHQMTNWPLDRLQVIYNGIEPEKIKQADPKFHQPPVVLSVGRVEAVKGFDVLLRALRIIKDRGERFVYILAGDGSQLSALKELATELDLNDCVQFKGYIQDVSGLLAEADILAAPSYSEGFSMTILEAMAAGLPVVGSDLPTFREALGDLGQLVPPGDAERLAEALSEMLHSPNESAGIGEKSRARVLALFPMQKTIEAYYSLYRSLLGKKGIQC